MYGFETMYQIMNEYIVNEMDEIEYAFVNSIKWPDNYVLNNMSDKFWLELQCAYDILITNEDKEAIVTVDDLKKRIIDKCIYNDVLKVQ